MLKKVVKICLSAVSWLLVPFFVNSVREVIRFIFDMSCTAALRLSSNHIGAGTRLSWKSRTIGLKGISIGRDCIFLPGLRLSAIDCDSKNPKLIIGDRVTVNTNCHFSCINGISIGNDTLIASHVFITDHSHGTTTLEDLQLLPNERRLVSAGKVEIGCGVWIGEGVTILPGTSIGDGAVVGANSVLRGSYPARSVIVGTPARVVKRSG